jgi:hypothetical protein
LKEVSQLVGFPIYVELWAVMELRLGLVKRTIEGLKAVAGP